MRLWKFLAGLARRYWHAMTTPCPDCKPGQPCDECDIWRSIK